MKTREQRIATAAAVFTLAWAGVVQAHHSQSMFDVSKAIWLKGTVVNYAPIAPHAMILLETEGEDGQVRQWVVEGPFPGHLNRILSLNGLSAPEDFLKPGDAIEVCGFAMKAQWKPERMYPNTIWSSKEFVHGQVLVLPDGQMQAWGAYGKMDNCVRPNDRARVWSDFLNRDPRARDRWCDGLNLKDVQSVAPGPFVVEVEGLLDEPCN